MNIKNPKKGYIYTIAGNGQPGSGGDLGAADKANIGEPYALFVTENGDIYVSQKMGSIIRMIDHSSGIIKTVAGVPNKYGYTGDHREAIKEQLNQPFGIFLDIKKNLYIADSNNMRIRKVDDKGIISTVTGRGEVGYLGDGAPAEDALISYPLDVVGDKKGNLFISDSANNVIRMIYEEEE